MEFVYCCKSQLWYKHATCHNEMVLQKDSCHSFTQTFHVVCFSHTIDNVGTHFKFRFTDIFLRHRISLYAHSYNAKLLWKATGQSMCSYID